MSASASTDVDDADLVVTHVRYRGAFGVGFFWHHAIVVGVPPAAGEADGRVVYHWSGGAQAQDKLEGLESAAICAVPWAEFQASADASEHACGVIETVQYSAEVLAANPPALRAQRARSFVGTRGLLAGVDAAGNAVEGYNPLTFNCEHLAVFVMTGESRSLQVETARAVAGVVGSVVASFSGDGGGRSRAFATRPPSADLSQLALVAGIGLGVLALTAPSSDNLTALGAAPPSADTPCDDAAAARAAVPQTAPAPEVGQRQRKAYTSLLSPPPAVGWASPALRTAPARDGSATFEALPLSALLCSGSAPAALNIELLRHDSTPHAPRRWLCASERHDALPFGLCYGHRLHAEPLVDATAAAFLALPSFQFWFDPRPGACPPRGLRGALYAAPARCSAAAPALFGLDHLRSSKFICAGVCAEFPGTDVSHIFHLGVAPTRDGAAATLTLADYTANPQEPPVDDGFALRWVEPGAGAHAHRSWPYFACTPEGFRRDESGAVPSAARFRFWLREPLTPLATDACCADAECPAES